MADGLKAALESKLVAYESAGMTDHVKAVKARLAQLEKPAKAPAAVKAAAPAAAATKAPARKTVKKAVKQTARKKH